MFLPPAKKKLGQHFLTDESVIARIVGEFAPRADETVIEIGSGRGALTAHLVDKVGRLVAVEFDRDLIALLSERFSRHKQFTLVPSDALTIDFCETVKLAAATAPASSSSSSSSSSCARVIANLPYNVSTAILQRLLEQRQCLTEMVLMLQREVVDRIAAPPASSERGYLSVLVQTYCEVEILFDVGPDSFRPPPKVWSTVVRLHVRPPPGLQSSVSDDDLLWRVVGAGFAQRRKTIRNNLRHAPTDLCQRITAAGGAESVLEAALIEPNRRAETLTIAEWARLSRSIEDKSELH